MHAIQSYTWLENLKSSGARCEKVACHMQTIFIYGDRVWQLRHHTTMSTTSLRIEKSIAPPQERLLQFIGSSMRRDIVPVVLWQHHRHHTQLHASKVTKSQWGHKKWVFGLHVALGAQVWHAWCRWTKTINVYHTKQCMYFSPDYYLNYSSRVGWGWFRASDYQYATFFYAAKY